MTPSRSAPDADELLEILAAIPDLVVLVGRDRTVRYVNRYEGGYEAEDIVGSSTADFMAPESRAQHIHLLESVFESGEPADELTTVVDADGEVGWWEGIMLPILRKGRVVAVAVVTRNVTARIEAEKELELLRSLLPVCSWCSAVRSEDGEWRTLEAYLEGASHSRVTHGMCPECARKVEGARGEEGGSESGGSTRTAAG